MAENRRSRSGFHSERAHKGTSYLKKHQASKEKRPIRQLEGIARMTREGFIFVDVEGQEEDIFVKANKTRGALEGDKVRVAITREAGNGHREEGEVLQILERSGKPFVGVLHIVGQQAWVLMQSKSMPYDISIKIQKEDAQDGSLIPLEGGEFEVAGVHETVDGKSRNLRAHIGMKVAVVVDDWKRGDPNPSGHLVDVLGELGDNNTEMHAILAEYGLPYRFEPEVENAADKISDKITDNDLKGRRDFRDTLTFTIDPADAKDFDDALSYKKLDNGNFEVGVHIADVSYYVKPGDVVDQEAQARGTSVYLVDRTVPMLPEKLSNKLCSLRPNEDKLTFSAVFEITPDAKVVSHWFGRTVIRSDWRFAYETAQQIIDAGDAALSTEIKGGTDGKSGDSDVFGVTGGLVIPDYIKQSIIDLWGLAEKFRHRRFASGAISFERPEMKVDVDEKGKPIGVHQVITKEANWLIEEFMLLANRSVAEFVATGGKMNGAAKKDAKTFIYRIHDNPDQMKLHNLTTFAGNFGYHPDFGEGRQSAIEINSLLDEAKDKPEFAALQTLALRSMAKACYSTDNIGHFGLAFKFYTHFTSPIRRYPDTMVHRLLALYLDGAKSQDKVYYEEQCQHASQREVIAANAERDSVKYKMIEFMGDKIGNEYDGAISGLTTWGMYVEIEPTKIEGMVSLREIKSDFFDFDEEHYRLVGRRTRVVYHLGDKVRIKVKATNLDQRILDYELIENDLETREKAPLTPEEKEALEKARAEKGSRSRKGGARNSGRSHQRKGRR